MKRLLTLLTMIGLTGCTVVGPGQRGISVYLGEASKEVKTSGVYLWVPFVRYVKKMDVKVQKSEAETEAASKDLQKVTAKIAINWHIDPDMVSKILTTIGDEDDIVTRIINPAVSEVLKASTAKMTAEEVLTKRIELKQNIDTMLVARLKNYSVIVDDISLVDLNFTNEFNHAVEAKQIAEQRSKQAEYEAQRAVIDAKAAVNKAEGEAKAQLIKAEAEAKANNLKQKTLTKELIHYESVQKWNGQLPQITGGAIPFINLDIKSSRDQK